MNKAMESMLDTYLFETNSLLEQLDEIMIEAEKNDTFSENDVNSIFRIMHTIKGSSAMMEFTPIATIAHRIEDLFFFIRENGMDSVKEEYRPDLFNMMFESTDALRLGVEKVEQDEPLDIGVEKQIEGINSLLNRISGAADNSEDTVKDENAPAKTEEDTDETKLPDIEGKYFIRIFFEHGIGMENLRALVLTTALKDIDLKFNFSPTDIETNPDTAGQIIKDGLFLSFESEDEAQKCIAQLPQSGNVESYELIEKKEKPNPSAEMISGTEATLAAAPTQTKPAKTKPAASDNNSTGGGGPVKQSLINVNLSKLDNLMAIVGEIVITESMVTASEDLEGLKLDNFTKSARQLRQLTDNLQDIAMSLRMVSVSGVFQKMNRIVRDMNAKLGKNAILTLIGADTEVDKTIVDNLGDPLMHIVRNSMDHGIEMPDERAAKGKTEQAEIILSATHTGSEVIISIKDNGGGMDPEKLLDKAERNGILVKPRSEYTVKEALMLTMMPGFSTNEQVTEFSGRGVGMDVVRKNIESVGGNISLSSELGVGTTTTLKIPLTMAIVDGMEIAVGNSIFTIPIANIRQSFKAKSSEIIYDSRKNELIKCMDDFYPIVRLHELYGIETQVTDLEDGILIWVEAGDRSCCLFVDELLGEHQVVVKPLPPYVNQFNVKDYGISGCTILGNGTISIILDIVSLHNSAIADIM